MHTFGAVDCTAIYPETRRWWVAQQLDAEVAALMNAADDV